MSILINLLPDLRQAKLRERRRRQMATGVAVVIWVICGGGLALMGAYELGQKAVIAAHSKAITEKKQELEAVPGLIEAMTAQQHSASLPGLYAQRVYMTKFFEAYGSLNPTGVTLSALSVDAQNALVVSGAAANYATVAKLARSLEAAKPAAEADATVSSEPYFSNVAITSVSNSSNEGVTFTLSATLGAGVVSGDN